MRSLTDTNGCEMIKGPNWRVCGWAILLRCCESPSTPDSVNPSMSGGAVIAAGCTMVSAEPVSTRTSTVFPSICSCAMLG